MRGWEAWENGRLEVITTRDNSLPSVEWSGNEKDSLVGGVIELSLDLVALGGQECSNGIGGSETRKR